MLLHTLTDSECFDTIIFNKEGDMVLTAFLITTLVVFSINLLIAIYAISINMQEGRVNSYGVIILVLSLIMTSWNIYCLINL